MNLIVFQNLIIAELITEQNISEIPLLRKRRIKKNKSLRYKNSFQKMTIDSI